MSSSSSLASGTGGSDRLPTAQVPHRRTISISATDPLVITTDRVRPDWHQKLAAARAHTARRSAAATALHTAAYLVGGRANDGDSRSFSGFGRRGILRRASGPDALGNNSSQLNMLALMSERYAAQAGSGGASQASGEGETPGASSSAGSSRRRRMEDLEEMMMMEAIRLSLASEEERRKREEKESKKEAKKKEKENKKAEKQARKSGASAFAPSDRSGEPEQATDPLISNGGKGKSTQDNAPDEWPPSSPQNPQTHVERARQQIALNETSSVNNSTPFRPSHLRTLSNASDSSSSVNDAMRESSKQAADEERKSKDIAARNSPESAEASSSQSHILSETPPGSGGPGLGSLNFRSLAAMIGTDEESVREGRAPINSEHEEKPPDATETIKRTDEFNPDSRPPQEI